MTKVRASLEVGFPDETLPPRLAPLRGRAWRRLATASSPFPFEDAQFEVVLLHASAVSHETVKEAHRVLRPEGRLVFSVPLRTRRCAGFTLKDVYSIVREGFHIVGVERTDWWRFWCKERNLSICAQKKTWKRVVNSYRPYL